MNPGVQKPHCAAPCLTKAFCRGCSFAGVPMPSIVVTQSPSASSLALRMHERTSLPLRITLQEPQCPVSHPILVPVSPTCSLRILARETFPSMMRLRSTPFTKKRFWITALQLPSLDCLPKSLESLLFPVRRSRCEFFGSQFVAPPPGIRFFAGQAGTPAGTGIPRDCLQAMGIRREGFYGTRAGRHKNRRENRILNPMT